MSRRVLVTGASRGVGAAIAGRFAALGDEVTAVSRDAAALTRVEQAAAGKGTIRVYVCDVTDETAVKGLAEHVGDLDVLVNNAGYSESAPLHETTLESWQAQMAVNATAVFLCTRAFIRGMRDRGEGRIITIASTAGRAGAAYASAYSASKHAAVGLMRSAAAELAGTRVTANAVCPAFVDTEMTQHSAERISQRTGRSVAESLEALAGLSPLRRLVTVDEIADAVEWLASPGAVAINGQTIVIDGGGLQT
ncbi:MAG TPA: SDR family oxidoreductase [Solirubrobacteraceae bacterium]|nr:SDR family oxidoreductase [Solirubrobacteraceae bacterium]